MRRDKRIDGPEEKLKHCSWSIQFTTKVQVFKTSPGHFIETIFSNII